MADKTNASTPPLHLLRTGRIGEWNRWRLTDHGLNSIDLRDADLADVSLRGANLIGVNLAGANLSGANLTHTNLTGSFLRNADLTYARALAVPDRAGDLIGVAVLVRADLTGANLHNADLVGADLRKADLVGANLRGADLTRANLRDADLTDADLRGTVLFDANLAGAELRNADLTEAIRDEAGRAPRGTFVAATEIKIPLPSEVDPSTIAELASAVAALARLVVTVGADINPPDGTSVGAGGTAVAVATHSPSVIEVTTARFHYGSDLTEWLFEYWHWAAVGGGGAAISSGLGYALRTLRKEGRAHYDSKLLNICYTLFTKTGRTQWVRIQEAKGEELLAKINARTAGHQTDIEEGSAARAKHRADAAESAVRYYKAVRKFPPISQQQARYNIAAETHLNPLVQAHLADSLDSLEPLFRNGVTATSIVVGADDSPPDRND